MSVSILDPRSNLVLFDEIKHILFSIRYQNNPIKIIGSASLKALQYYGDFDFRSVIDKKDSPEIIYEEFKKILKKINDDPNLYFLELKIQLTDGEKFKYYVGDKLDLKTIKENHDKISVFKIDFAVWIDYKFVNASINYLFCNDPTSDEFDKEVQNNIKELEKDKKYYKILKRKFLLYKGEEDSKKVKELIKIFNSKLGLKYKIASNIETLGLVLQNYHDKHTKERVLINLKVLRLEHYDLKYLDKEAEKLKKEVDQEAKKYIPKFPI